MMAAGGPKNHRKRADNARSELLRSEEGMKRLRAENAELRRRLKIADNWVSELQHRIIRLLEHFESGSNLDRSTVHAVLVIWSNKNEDALKRMSEER